MIHRRRVKLEVKERRLVRDLILNNLGKKIMMSYKLYRQKELILVIIPEIVKGEI